MSNEFVKNIENRFYNNATKSYVVTEWKNVFLKSVFKTSNAQFPLYFFRKCSEQFLTCQDQTGSYVIHGLVKSQLPTTTKTKILTIVLKRDINVNQLDGTKRTALDYLVDNNDIECTEVLLKHSHCLQISDKCLSRALQLRNAQNKVCEMLFTYADKNYIAPHLTKAYLSKEQCMKSEKDDMEASKLNDKKCPFSHKYIKLKYCNYKLCDLKRSSPNISSGPIKLPNHEEIDMLFEISITDHKDTTSSLQKSEKKLAQKSLTKTAKTKNYLNAKEAIAYSCSIIRQKNSKIPFSIQNTSLFKDNRCNEDKLSGYSSQQDSVIGNRKYKVLGLGSYGPVYDALNNGQRHAAKASNPCTFAKASNGQTLQEIKILKSLNHPNVVQLVGTYYHRKMSLLVMETRWLIIKLSEWLKINPSASLKNKLCILIDVANGLKYLHSQNIIHCDLIANNILLTTNLQAKIGGLGMAKMAGQNMIQVPSDFSHMPPEVCTPHSICTETLDVFSFGCVMIHTITQKFSAVNKKLCVKDTEIKRRSKYFNKIKSFSMIYSIILHCLQDNPSHRPSANKLHCLLKACVVLKSHYYSDELLKHKEIGQGSYNGIHHNQPCVGKVWYPFTITNSAKNCVKVNSSELVPSLRSLGIDYTNIIHFLDVHNMSAVYKADSLVFERSVSCNLVHQATGNLLKKVKDLVYVTKTYKNYLLLMIFFDDIPPVRENLLEDYNNKDNTSTSCQTVSSSFQHNKDILYVSTTQSDHLPVFEFEETNSEATIDTCVNDLHESYSPFHAVPITPCSNLNVNVIPLQAPLRGGILSEKEKSRTRGFTGCHDEDSFVDSKSCDSLYRFPSSTTLCSFPESSTNSQESFQHVGEPSRLLSHFVIGQRMYLPFHAVSTISCSNLTCNETVFQDGVLTKQHKNESRGFGDGSSDSSSDEDNIDEDKRGTRTSLVSHYYSHNPQQHSLPHSPRYHSISAAINTSITPQTAAGTGLIGSKHDGRMQEVATAKPFVSMGITLPKSPAMYTSKGEYLISDSRNTRGPILLDIPNGRNELVMAAYSTQSIPKPYPILHSHKEFPGIAPLIPIDLKKIHTSKKMTSIASHQHMVREQPVKSGFDVKTVQQPHHMASVASHQQQQVLLSQSMDFSDPVIIIDRAAVFLTAGDYGATIKVIEILDKHLVLPDDIDMAKEFGQGLANYKNLHYKAAKSCFTALFEKSINYHSPGNQALASIYLGEIEISWAKYKNAEKYFTLAVANYNPENVAEKYQQIILTKSAVLVKKGQCHRSLSQIKEAINAFKIAKEVAESPQQQARGSKLKMAKEDELSAVCALGNILQSIGDYDQSFDYYEKSLKLAGELRILTMNSDLYLISVPFKIQDICRTFELRKVPAEVVIECQSIELKSRFTLFHIKNYCFHCSHILCIHKLKSNIEISVNCVSESLSNRVNTFFLKSGYVSRNNTSNTSFNAMMGNESLQRIPVQHSESLVVNELRSYSAFHIIPCSNVCVHVTIFQGSVLSQRKVNAVRGSDDESDSCSQCSDNKNPNQQDKFVLGACHTMAFPPYPSLKQPSTENSLKLDLSKKVTSTTLYQTGSDLAGIASNNQCQQLIPHALNQSMDFSDPASIIRTTKVFLIAGDYEKMIKVLEILDEHPVLPHNVDMAKEFGQGLANYKNKDYEAAKSCFTALYDKSINYHSPGNQALASIYLGEIEMLGAKYNDAEKHFTIALANYSPENVAEKYQQIILTKSAVLVKKGQCHRSLSQIKEAINAFKMAKEVAELAQQQARGSKLKMAKEDELSAVCALGNILQSIGDYDQSFDYYEKSLKLAGELGDQVSIGWAHGNLGNAMLGLDQKDKALDHLITAFYMSARYEGNPLAVGRAVSNLGNAYQAIGNLPKAMEHYEIALGHGIYGNDLEGQARACGNIGNIHMLMKKPAQAVHYHTETLHLSTDRDTRITGHHNRGCARFDVAECIIQGKKPKELVPATTQDLEYGRLTIKLTDKVITTDPVQETKPNRDPSAQSISEQKESSISVEMLPVVIKGKIYEGVASVEITQMAEALPFLETAQRDLLEAIESHEQCVQNVKGSHEALSLSLSLFESNSRSFYKMQVN